MTRYRTIVADPPWDYGPDNARQVSITRGGNGPRTIKSIGYPTMSIVEISALPVHEMAENDARLFMWTTNRHLPESFGVMDAWGFTYKQTLVWHKTGNPSPFGGSVAPNHAEFLLVGTAGKPASIGRLAGSVVSLPAAVSGHSAKPEAWLDFIETVSPGPYLEMFARRNRLGWDTWGNEALEHVQIGGSA